MRSLSVPSIYSIPLRVIGSPASFHAVIPPARTRSRLKAFPSQDLCRSDRAAFLVSDGDDGSCTVRRQLVKLFVEFGQRTQHRLCNVPPLPDKLVRVPDIEHKR